MVCTLSLNFLDTLYVHFLDCHFLKVKYVSENEKTKVCVGLQNPSLGGVTTSLLAAPTHGQLPQPILILQWLRPHGKEPLPINGRR